MPRSAGRSGHGGCDRDGIRHLDAAFVAVTDCAALMKRLRDADLTVEQARADGRLSPDEAARIDDMRAKVTGVIRVDDFSPEEIAHLFPEAPRPAASSSRPTTRRKESAC